jgi:hypothetical protein
MSIGIPRIYFGSCLVHGADGTLTWLEGEIDDVQHPSTGVFVFDMASGVTPLEHFAVVSFLSLALESDLTYEISFPPGGFQIQVNTFANGLPYDADFYFDAYHVRTANPGDVVPPPSPLPPPPSGATVPIDIFVAPAPAGNDANPGTLARPVLTLDRALALLPDSWGSSAIIHMAPGTMTLSAFNVWVGSPEGPLASPLLIEGGFTNELGTLAATAGSTDIDIIDSALASIRNGFGSFVAGAPAGMIRFHAGAGTPFTLADTGRMFMIRLGNSFGNNSTFRATFVDSTHIDLTNPQGVIADANNGFIYWQESFEGGSLSFSSGPNAGQRRSIRDHGLEASGTINVLPVSGMADNNWVFIPDGLGAGMHFEFKVTGGFVAAAPLPRTTVDISALADTSANGVAQALTTAINALLPSVLAIRGASTNNPNTTAATWPVAVVNMQLGSAGNLAMTLGGGLGGAFTVVGMAGGVGTPLTTFRVNAPFGAVAGVGDAFQVEKPASTISFINPLGQTFVGDSVGFLGIRFSCDNAGGGIFFISIDEAVMYCGCEFDMQGSQLGTKETWVSTNMLGVGSNWLSLPPPFPTSQEGCGVFVHDGTSLYKEARLEWTSIIARNEVFNVEAGSDVANFAIDAKRSSLRVQDSRLRIRANDPRLPARFNGQTTAASNQGLISIESSIPNNENALGQFAVQTVDVSNSAGDGIALTQFAKAAFGNPVTGNFNTGVGLRATNGSKALVVGAGVSITGTQGDMLVGLKPTRLWSNFNTLAPQQNEFDALGDGSRVAVASPIVAGVSPVVKYTPLALGNFAGGGSIGTAAQTVDIAGAISIAQTTAAQTLTIPNPTDTGSGRKLVIINQGTVAFTIGGTGGGSVTRSPPANTTVEFTWSTVHSVWSPHSLT